VPDQVNGLPWPSPIALYALWNALAPAECPAAELMDAKRDRRARERLAEFPERAWWEQVMAEVASSSLLRGKANGPGHEHWRCNPDWLLAGSKDGGALNCPKVWEGRYRDGK
jgi:hypothetical protein